MLEGGTHAHQQSHTLLCLSPVCGLIVVVVLRPLLPPLRLGGGKEGGGNQEDDARVGSGVSNQTFPKLCLLTLQLRVGKEAPLLQEEEEWGRQGGKEARREEGAREKEASRD